MKTQLLAIVVTTIAAGMTFFISVYPDELLLQHIPTAVGLLLLGWVVVRYGLTPLSFGCVLAFWWLHLIGAIWIYSFVPYDEFSTWIFGGPLSEAMGWQRNHYDRFVHLASGFLIAPPASECLQRVAGMRSRGAAVMSIAVVLAIGAIYEVLEWQIAVQLSPTQAEAYNGQQGDIWDPQKDLALALVASVPAAACLLNWKPNPSR
jgi:putative membrane protein